MNFRFEPLSLPPEAENLRCEVREFLTEALRGMPVERRADTWTGFDATFSKALGARGWIGMTWPKQFGGGERSALERYVMLEEVLAAGAPVAAHWFADRQSGRCCCATEPRSSAANCCPAWPRVRSISPWG